MKLRATEFMLPVIVAVIFAATATDRAQDNFLRHATNFTSETYFDPPHEQQIKMRLSGAEASPLPGGLMDVKRLRIEMFNTAGKPEFIVKAPQCNYSPLDGVANSAGHIEIDSGNGKLHVAGKGFLWRQEDNSLTISNDVHTIIRSGFLKIKGS